MNIYKVGRRDDWSWDDYIGFICVAPNENIASIMGPNGELNNWGGSWVKSVEDVMVEMIGVADIYLPQGVILAVYNAG